MRKNVKMVLLFKGVLCIIIIKLVSDFFNLVTVGLLLEYVIMWGPLALIIIFQPEIRNILEHIGRNQLLGRHKILTLDEREIYKWYFFYQLCMLKWRSQDRKYIKDAFWDYLHDNEKDSEINRLYLEFCIYRDNQYKK